VHPPDLFSSIYRIVEHRADEHPDSIAIESPGLPSLSCSSLLSRVNQIILAIQSAGITKSDRVAIVLPNGMDLAVTLLGTTSACTAAPLNPSYQKREFLSYYADLHVKLVILSKRSNPDARTAASELGIPVWELEFNAGATTVDKLAIDDLPSGDDVAVVLHTSGSTSRPKIVPLTHRNICISTQAVAIACRLTTADRCLCVWQQYHIGGLVDLLLVPLASGGTIICADNLRAEVLYTLLRDYKPTWYQTVPTTMSELLACARRKGESNIVSSLKFIRSVAAELPPAMMEEAESLFGVPVLQTFGMTEAAPLVTSNPLPPARRIPGSVGTSVGPDVGIMDPDGKLLPAGELGEVVIRGGNVMSGYEGLPEVNIEAFKYGWFHSGDLGYMDHEGYLFLRGRIKEIINRGGEKISPREIDTVLLEHPAVEQAVAFSIPHRTLGEGVAAAVVLRPGKSVDEAELRTFVASRLIDFKVPQKIIFVNELPKGPTGKINRIGMAVALKLNLSVNYIPPVTDLEKRLAGIWADVLGAGTVGRQDNFFDLGGNSLLVIRLVGEVEKFLGKPIPISALKHVYTVEQMAAALLSDVSGTDGEQPVYSTSLTDGTYRSLLAVMGSGEFPAVNDRSLVKIAHPSGTQPPLFWCFNSPEREMHGMAHAFGSDQPIYGLFSGGGVFKDSPPMIKAVADHYVSELLLLHPEGSFRLGGNCRGGKVAVEIAHCLQAAGRTIEYLCVLDHFQPRLFNYPGRMLLMYGRQSAVRAYRAFRWGGSGWRKQFGVTPDVCWVFGTHGQYFRPENITSVIMEIKRFLSGTAPARTAKALLPHYIWHVIHRVPGLLFLINKITLDD
jgi:acyl-CoA synthetase (AMP-forming)/AMP-acid ligase II/acyl carrier protein